jgi:hypothetical protein
LTAELEEKARIEEQKEKDETEREEAKAAQAAFAEEERINREAEQ